MDTNRTLRRRSNVMFSSMMAVMMVSMLTNWVLRPIMMIMRKNKIDQTGAAGKKDIAAGLTMKVRPIPGGQTTGVSDNCTIHV